LGTLAKKVIGGNLEPQKVLISELTQKKKKKEHMRQKYEKNKITKKRPLL
jgi:hypothetical protein